MCRYPVFPAPFVEKAVFSSVHTLASIIKNQVAVAAWIYVQVIYSVPLVSCQYCAEWKEKFE
jgi:hypothetical protein